jgi:hypothetical protein
MKRTVSLAVLLLTLTAGASTNGRQPGGTIDNWFAAEQGRGKGV